MRQLVSRTLSGDRDAYRKIVEEHHPMLVAYISFRVPYSGLVDELVHLTFIRAYELLEEYDGDRDFGVWLRTLAHYQILREFKRYSREKEKLASYADRIRMELWEQSLDPEPEEQTYRLLSECLEKLTDRSRELVELRYHKKSSVKDIAHLKEEKVSWVTTTLARIRQKLRECMESEVEAAI